MTQQMKQQMKQQDSNDQNSFNTDFQSDTDLLIKEDVRVKRPKKYQVVLLNDDYTPMDFVVWVLQTVFYFSLEDSTHLMLDVHTKGKGYCGSFTHDVARSKMAQIHQLAEEQQHPLQCRLESQGEPE